MTKTNRARVDYMPGPAAQEVLQAARDLYPHSNTQALIDRLVIVGYSALVQARWEPPRLSGRDRDGWKLPADLRQHLPDKEG